ncbi:MAG: metal ABC transporter ATP-binding protein [Spirochaetales bacterium]|nr:metal ABC transporter ATP-binding protein [Spirochaetales bacterium]
MDGKPVIQIQDLAFSYGGVPLFSGINGCIHRGDYITVVGPNGGGKSTLIKLITGLLTPTGGSITIGENRENRNTPLIGYVPQYVNFDALFPATVEEAVLTGTLTRGWGFYTKQNREAAREALEQVGLDREGARSFSEISGGQRQRTLIARALASRPEILILDEPTASVDTEVQRQLRELLSRLNKSLTIVLVTHDFGFVDRDVNRVFCVNHGLKEHPVEKVNEDIITASYGRPVMAVRHDHELAGHHHTGEKE